MNDNGLHLTRGTSVPALASGLISWLNGVSADPYDAPVVFVPGAGMQRWLSQQIAVAGVGGEGICAGIRFEPLAQLESLVSGRDPADDPWAPERLVWRILELVDARTDGLEPLAHHLAGSEQRYANAARIAFLLDRYTRLRPGLLQTWLDADAPDDLGLGFDTWQPALLRALHASVPGPDPLRRRAALLADLAAGRGALDAPAIAVFGPRQLTAPDADLLAALAAGRRVDAWVRVAGPAASPHPLAVRLGSRSAETAALLTERAASVVDLEPPSRPGTLLGALQADLDLGRAPRRRSLTGADRSLRIHASHGPDRQAEVLREVLSGLFSDDPTLEPRHVVVACPDPGALAPHLGAVFAGDAGPGAHPGHTFRVQVAERGAAETNTLYRLVREVAQLGTTRASAGQLLSLATHPFVARRFGFVDDDADRLAELVEHAAVRWGLGDAHRAAYGLERVRQGTWQVGVQRLLLGEALSDDELASVGVIAPVDDVESSDVTLLGGLAELVSRVSRLARRPERASAAQWVEHLGAIVDQLSDVPFDESWQLAQLWSVLELLRRRGGDSPALLGSADALALLDAEFARRTGRPAYGDGSLVVCGLTALAQVPHRVVCLVGLDERTFPRRALADGDDLLAADPQPGEPDHGRDDRQAILDAVGAASEALVIIYQGWSSHTLERRPAPAGVQEIVEAAAATGGVPAGELVVDEPLQPFSPTLFGPEPRSFDRAALRGARALVSPRRGPTPSRYAVGHLPLSEHIKALEREQLRAFLAHPARYFLRERAGLTIGDESHASDEIPLELDALALWQIGDRLLDRLLRGHGVEDARHAEWLRGDLPPGNLGRRQLDAVTDTAVRVARDAAPFLEDTPGLHVIDLDLDGVRLTGRATTRGDVALSVEYSKVGARHLAQAWIDTLALTVTLERPTDAVLFGGGRRKRLTAPDPDRARALLSTLTYLATEGQTRVLPLPPRVAQLWAECRARNTDPMADRNRDRFWAWDRDQAWDAVLPAGARPWDELVDGEPWAQRGERTILGSLAELVWRPIVRAER